MIGLSDVWNFLKIGRKVWPPVKRFFTAGQRIEDLEKRVAELEKGQEKNELPEGDYCPACGRETFRAVSSVPHLSNPSFPYSAFRKLTYRCSSCGFTKENSVNSAIS